MTIECASPARISEVLRSLGWLQMFLTFVSFNRSLSSVEPFSRSRRQLARLTSDASCTMRSNVQSMVNYNFDLFAAAPRFFCSYPSCSVLLSTFPMGDLGIW